MFHIDGKYNIQYAFKDDMCIAKSKRHLKLSKITVTECDYSFGFIYFVNIYLHVLLI